jgi:hypothetical protein
MRRKITNSLRAGTKFKNEFRKQIRMIIIVTFGFTIAFTWRQTIFDLSTSVVKFFTQAQGSTLSILASLLITIISVIIIYLSAHFLKDDREYNN